MKNIISRCKLLGAALFLSALCLGSAQANMITLNLDFTASGFLPAGAPFDPVFGNFSVTFDNSANINNSSGVAATINIPLTGGFIFSYSQSLDRFILGGALNGVGVSSGTNDFFLLFSGASTGIFTNPALQYSNTISPGSIFGSGNVILTQAGGGAGVPDEASTLGLLAVAFAGLVSFRQLRHRATA